MASGFDESQHPRGPGGKFASSGAIKEYAARAHEREAGELQFSAKKSVALYRQAIVSGGITHDVAKDVTPHHGYSVSTSQEHERIIEGSLTHEHLARYLEDKKEALSKLGAVLGAWHDAPANRWYLDVSQVTPSRNKALRLAKQHGQEGIYDLGQKKTIIVKARRQRRGLSKTGPP